MKILPHPFDKKICKMNSPVGFRILLVALFLFSTWASAQTGAKPNIIVILSDDVGWGDISANQPSNKFKTPAVDQLAEEGMRFTNAHAPHAVCTPTRYSLLTGRYCWRTFVREGVLPGYSKPLIPQTRITLASLCKQQGYATGAFGKWHIGLDWQPVEGDPGDFHYGSQIHAAHGAVDVPKEFQGKSGVSSRADKVLWVNKSVGRITESLNKTGQASNTLIIYTSDNGPYAFGGEDLKQGHDASGPYRGFKTDAWDGGTRVPFIARWPGKIEPGTTNDNLLCLTDIMSTLSAVFDTPLPDWAGEDSFNQLPNFLGETKASGRESMITQSYTGILSIRRGKWKLILDTKGSGGFYRYSPEVQRHTTMSPWRPDMSDSGQLYDIINDPYESTNIFAKHPDVVNELKNQLRAYINSGRTRPLN